MLTRISVVTFAMLMASGAFGPGGAAEIETGGCIGSHRAFSCTTVWGSANDPNIRAVPALPTAQEQEALAARERQWVARCHPMIRQDHYGVSRYHYAARGCEFGVLGSN